MSTKIYDAFVAKGKGISELYPELLRLQELACRVSRRTFTQNLAREACRMADANAASRAGVYEKAREEFKRPLSSAWLRQVREYAEDNKEGRISVDYDARLALIPKGKDTFLKLHTFNPEIAKIFSDMEKRGEIEDFSYWNNSDPPSGISQEEWSGRKGTWEELLKGASFMSERALMFDLVLRHRVTGRAFSEDEIMSALPDFEKRAQAVAQEVYLERNLPGQGAERMSQVAGLMSQFREGGAEVDKVISEVKKALKKEVAYEDLKG